MRLVHWWWRCTGRAHLSAAVRKLCEAHDAAYHPGGTAAARVIADAELSAEVAKLGQPLLARLMFIGVGIGGHPLLPLPWRWGYGWKWPRGYTNGS